MTDIRMHMIGKVQRRAVLWQIDNIAARAEDINPVLENLALYSAEKILAAFIIIGRFEQAPSLYCQ